MIRHKELETIWPYHVALLSTDLLFFVNMMEPSGRINDSFWCLILWFDGGRLKHSEKKQFLNRNH